MVLSSLFFKEIRNNGMPEARDICLRLLKGKQQKWVRQPKSLGLATVMIVSHNYFSEWSRAHFPTTFLEIAVCRTDELDAVNKSISTC